MKPNRKELVVLELLSVVRVDSVEQVTKDLFEFCGGEGRTVNDLHIGTRPMTDQEWKETQQQLDVADDTDNVEYIDIHDCIAQGTHLQNVDEDGYCNLCGDQISAEELAEEEAEMKRRNEKH